MGRCGWRTEGRAKPKRWAADGVEAAAAAEGVSWDEEGEGESAATREGASRIEAERMMGGREGEGEIARSLVVKLWKAELCPSLFVKTARQFQESAMTKMRQV